MSKNVLQSLLALPTYQWIATQVLHFSACFWKTNSGKLTRNLCSSKKEELFKVLSLSDLCEENRNIFYFIAEAATFHSLFGCCHSQKKKKLEKTKHWQLALNSIFLKLFLFFSPVLFFFGSQAEEGFCGGFFFDQTTSVKFLKNSCCCCLLQMKTRILFNVY